MAILLNGWILPFCGVASVKFLRRLFLCQTRLHRISATALIKCYDINTQPVSTNHYLEEAFYLTDILPLPIKTVLLV